METLEIEPTLLEQESINVLVDQFKKFYDKFPSYGPAISIAYFADTFIPPKEQYSEKLTIDLTQDNNLQSDLLYVQKIISSLNKAIKKSEDFNENSFYFKIKQSIDTKQVPSVFKKSPLISINLSTTEKYFEGYNDSVGAMYNIDAIGNVVSALLLADKKNIFWIGSNYNFNGKERNDLTDKIRYSFFKPFHNHPALK